MLKGKNVVLAVTGSIAAYKIAGLASALKKLHCTVDVLMTQNATNFINPITFETLTGSKCLIDTFDRNFQYSVEHISIAKKADVVLVAPASANVIGKLANGIADDMLTTTVMACTCKKIIAPAMNTNMYLNPIVQDNLSKLQRFGMTVIQPDSGYLACGDTGVGKMPSEEELLNWILREITYEKDLAGKKILVTAGATREKIDPVRFISNRSTGKMGYAIARNAMLRGAEVTLVSGETTQSPVPFVKMVQVESAQDMFDAVSNRAPDMDIIIKAAAVADYRPAQVSTEKIKKKEGEMTIPLERTTDILGWLGSHRKEGQFLCGFSMETQNMIENSRAKLEKKHVDMIVANNLKEKGAGFGTDTNIVTMITADSMQELPVMSKDEVAKNLLDCIIKRMKLNCFFSESWRQKMHNELTEKDIKKMQEEIDYRKLVLRKELIEHVKEAREQGDLSENFEYYAAKRDKNRNESRIRYLDRMIKTAVVISDESSDDEIGVNNTVELYFEEDDELQTVKLITTVRGNSLSGLISIESPMGKALLGHKVGDRVLIKVNDNYSYYVVVKSIENTTDDGTDKLRSY